MKTLNKNNERYNKNNYNNYKSIENSCLQLQK